MRLKLYCDITISFPLPLDTFIMPSLQCAAYSVALHMQLLTIACEMERVNRPLLARNFNNTQSFRINPKNAIINRQDEVVRIYMLIYDWLRNRLNAL
jgi:hypothetical protein